MKTLRKCISLLLLVALFISGSFVACVFAGTASTPIPTTTLAPTRAPQPPTLLSPLDWETGVLLTPMLQVSTYIHPQRVAHRATRWQISTVSTFPASEIGAMAAYLVFDYTSTNEQLELHVPTGTLAMGTTYYWRTRFEDAERVWSEWSATQRFTTQIAPPMPTPTNSSSGGGCSLLAGGTISAFLLLLPLTLMLGRKSR